MGEKHTAIVLAAGKGKRMNSAVQKQYLLIHGKPVLFYSLNVFEQCPFIDEIVLVTGKGEEDYCQKEIVEAYGFQKVKQIVTGGAERYHSVYEGIKAAEQIADLHLYPRRSKTFSHSGNLRERTRSSRAVWKLCGGNAC